MILSQSTSAWNFLHCHDSEKPKLRLDALKENRAQKKHKISTSKSFLLKSQVKKGFQHLIQLFMRQKKKLFHPFFWDRKASQFTSRIPSRLGQKIMKNFFSSSKEEEEKSFWDVFINSLKVSWSVLVMLSSKLFNFPLFLSKRKSLKGKSFSRTFPLFRCFFFFKFAHFSFFKRRK